jgi:hypothetical protein
MSVLIFFVAGVLTGWIIRKRPKLVIASNWGATLFLGVLIFLMGLSTGSRSDIMENFSSLGLTSVVLALAGVFGGILLTLPLARKFKKVDCE